jgi:hypothetical protein
MMRSKQQQRGIAILTITILIALAAITYFLTLMSPAELKIDRQEQTQMTLKQAKQALIAYAATYTDRAIAGKYGHLPCPDLNGNNPVPGNPSAICDTSNSVSIGYFPWKGNGMNLDALRDSAGNCLFYAVSTSYKTAPVSSTDMLNEDTNGLIQIVDSTGTPVVGGAANSRPVAVIFAAGAALAGQNRNPDGTTICGNDYGNMSAYLDNDGITDNANPVIADDAISQFVNASAGSENTANPLNDRLITISREEIWDAILNRSDFKTKVANLTHALAECLLAYSANPLNTGNRLPWPAPVNFVGGDYREDISYNDESDRYAGRFPYQIDTTNMALGLAGNELLNRTDCNNIDIGTGTPINFNQAGDEYRKLWENWKDHFFYAISKIYEPVVGGMPSCAGNCITVEDNAGVVTSYSGIVFYSDSRLAGQSRDAPPPAGDNDDKAAISNYLENGNNLIFTVATGTQTDTYHTNGSNPATANDIMFCIKSDLSDVTSC